jgi:hypothetical protein
MGMISQQGPGENSGAGLLSQLPQPIYKILLVLLILYNPAFLNPSENNMLQSAKCIQPGLTRHGIPPSALCQLYPNKLS